MLRAGTLPSFPSSVVAGSGAHEERVMDDNTKSLLFFLMIFTYLMFIAWLDHKRGQGRGK